MDSKYPDGNGSADARPRRRRDRDNPYEIFSVGIETAHPRFYLAFTDGCGVRHCLEVVLYRLQAEALRSAINELPEIQRRRLKLYYFEGLTYEEIAALEGCSHPAVMKSVSAALQRMKKIFLE